MTELSPYLIWFALLLVVGLAIAVMLGYWLMAIRTSARSAPAVPMSPLQRLACFGFSIGVGWLLALLGAFVATGGAENYATDASARLLVSALFVVGLAANAGALGLARRRPRLLRLVVDERDRKAVSMAPGIQLGVMTIALAAWMIGLTEAYWDVGHVPVVFLYLIFLSVVAVNIVAAWAGIVLGYWRIGSDD